MVAVSPAHNEVALWAWGEHDSWLRAGATTAVLADGWTDPADHGPSAPRSLSLQAGDVVVFEATPDPSGIGPPDPAQRHPVRLTAVHPSVDRLYDQAILEITWAEAEALPFDLQVSAPGLLAPRCSALWCAATRSWSGTARGCPSSCPPATWCSAIRRSPGPARTPTPRPWPGTRPGCCAGCPRTGAARWRRGGATPRPARR